MLETGISVVDWLLWADIVRSGRETAPSVAHAHNGASWAPAVHTNGNGAAPVVSTAVCFSSMLVLDHVHTSDLKNAWVVADRTFVIRMQMAGSLFDATSAPRATSPETTATQTLTAAVSRGMLLVLDGMTTVVAYQVGDRPAGSRKPRAAASPRVRRASMNCLCRLLRNPQSDQALSRLRSGVVGCTIAAAALRWAWQSNNGPDCLVAAAIRSGSTLSAGQIERATRDGIASRTDYGLLVEANGDVAWQLPPSGRLAGLEVNQS
jgi:hypothetical protein